MMVFSRTNIESRIAHTDGLRVCICESAGPQGSGIQPQSGKTFFELNVTDPIFLFVLSGRTLA
jgi:hypothetical protein